MDNGFSTEYDAIVVGTGMVESIVAAALSRIGKTVLHLDENEYYGQLWSSFNFEGIQTWIETNKEQQEEDATENNFSEFLKGDEIFVQCPKKQKYCWNIKQSWFCNETSVVHEATSEIPSEVDESNILENSQDTEKKEQVVKDNICTKNEWTKERIMNEYRKFNLDITPKVLFSRGLLIELLIQSNIARYAEFKCVNRVLTFRNGLLEPVPSSRADVFATKNVSVVEKRMLVKILTMCSQYPENIEEFQDIENKTFLEFLKQKKLSDNLIYYILYAISMSTKSTSCEDGIRSTKAFLLSLGRYGNTPFLFPMYGTGELPQCFCRLCAVFGGVYHLNRGVQAALISADSCTAVVSEGQRLSAKHVVFSTATAPKSYVVDDTGDVISRGIFLTDRSILPHDKEPLTILKFPPSDNVDNAVTVVEIGSGTHVCPPEMFVVHMTTKMKDTPEDDLKHVVQALFKQEPHQEEDMQENLTDDEKNYNEKPKVIWSLTWSMKQGSKKTINCPKNILVTSGPDLELDIDASIKEAEEVFKKICPDEEFLPRAPDPEEIVFGEEDKDEEQIDGSPEITNLDDNFSSGKKAEESAQVCEENSTMESDKEEVQNSAADNILSEQTITEE